MSVTDNDSPISTPLAHRLRAVRHKGVPLAIWICAVVVLVVWSQSQSRVFEGVGMVEARQVTIAPTADGTLSRLAVDVFDTVDEGQVLALMDDTMVSAELIVAEAELSQLRMTLTAESTKLDAELAATEAESLDDIRRFRRNEEEARLELLDRLVEQESGAIRLERLRLAMNRLQQSVDQRISSKELYDEARLEYEEQKKRLDENTRGIEAAEQLLARSTERREEREAQELSIESATYLAPLREALNAQEARINAIKQQRTTLALNAPVSGQITRVFLRPGQTALAGDPILAITEDTAPRVLAYVAENAAGQVETGSEVRLQSQVRPGIAATGRVLRTGSLIEDLPPALAQIPILPERGYPVLIAEVPQGTFLPGERLSVQIRN